MPKKEVIGLTFIEERLQICFRFAFRAQMRTPTVATTMRGAAMLLAAAGFAVTVGCH